MLTTPDYLVAWSVYLVSAGVVLLTLWRLTRSFWGWLRDLLRVACGVVFLVPAAVESSGEYLAPAVFIVAFELLTVPEGGVGPLLGVRLLLILIFTVLGVWTLRLLWYWLIVGKPRRARD